MGGSEMTDGNSLERAKKAERKLVKRERKAERAFLQARAKHARAEKKPPAAAAALLDARGRLEAVQSARAGGPSETAKPAGE